MRLRARGLGGRCGRQLQRCSVCLEQHTPGQMPLDSLVAVAKAYGAAQTRRTRIIDKISNEIETKRNELSNNKTMIQQLQ